MEGLGVSFSYWLSWQSPKSKHPDHFHDRGAIFLKGK
jgi:hypothetical protein